MEIILVGMARPVTGRRLSRVKAAENLKKPT